MRYIKVLLVIICLLVSVTVQAANTITSNGGVITITSIDSDWTLSDTVDIGKQYVYSIQFNPGAANDQCVVLDGDASGPTMMDVTSQSVYDQRLKTFPKSRTYMPFLDYSAGTYSSGATVIITLY